MRPSIGYPNIDYKRCPLTEQSYYGDRECPVLRFIIHMQTVRDDRLPNAIIMESGNASINIDYPQLTVLDDRQLNRVVTGSENPLYKHLLSKHSVINVR